MFDELSEKLEATFARLRGRGVLNEADIKEGLREVRRVLLEADVNFQLTREFLERVEKRAVGVSSLKTVSPAQQLVKMGRDIEHHILLHHPLHAHSTKIVSAMAGVNSKRTK